MNFQGKAIAWVNCDRWYSCCCFTEKVFQILSPHALKDTWSLAFCLLWPVWPKLLFWTTQNPNSIINILLNSWGYAVLKNKIERQSVHIKRMTEQLRQEWAQDSVLLWQRVEPPLSPLLQKTSLNVRAHLAEQQRWPLYIVVIFLYIWAKTSLKSPAAPRIQRVMCLQKWPKEKQNFILLWSLIFLKQRGRKNKVERFST